MNKELLPILVTGVILLVAVAVDRSRRKRAKQISTSWNCFRCGKTLGSLQSAWLPVAGEGSNYTKARFCAKCAMRVYRFNRVVWLLLIGAFLATFVVLYLASP